MAVRPTPPTMTLAMPRHGSDGEDAGAGATARESDSGARGPVADGSRRRGSARASSSPTSHDDDASTEYDAGIVTVCMHRVSLTSILVLQTILPSTDTSTSCKPEIDRQRDAPRISGQKRSVAEHLEVLAGGRRRNDHTEAAQARLEATNVFVRKRDPVVPAVSLG